jgi:hypothetical protein
MDSQTVAKKERTGYASRSLHTDSILRVGEHFLERVFVKKQSHAHSIGIILMEEALAITMLLSMSPGTFP